jgi:hypothetical protein
LPVIIPCGPRAGDVDGSGTLTYTELLNALSGQRYDAFLSAPPPPPFPPLLICAPADPFAHNARFLDDVSLLVQLANEAVEAASTEATRTESACADVASAEVPATVAAAKAAAKEVAKKRAGKARPGVSSAGGAFSRAQAAAARRLPPYTPLGLARGDEPCSTDLPSWSRPEIHCDPSGGPHERTLLPLTPLWQALFGHRPMPLWLGYTPGSLFAVSRTAVLAPRPAGEPTRAASKLYQRAACACGLDQRRDPVAELALERLWRHLFVPEP